MGLSRKIWSGKRVLVTGHTGFKGSWLTLILKSLGADVIGFSLPPQGPKSLYTLAEIGKMTSDEYMQDIRDEIEVQRVFYGNENILLMRSKKSNKGINAAVVSSMVDGSNLRV